MQVTRAQIMTLIVLVALLIQVQLPTHLGVASRLDLALLMVIYLASTRSSALNGLGVGVLIGIIQDSLTEGPIGVLVTSRQ